MCMGILGLGDGVGLGRARSQPERLLVLRIYFLWGSVYIFVQDVKVQWLWLQASVDTPVNRARDRCEPGAGSIRKETGLAALHGPVPAPEARRGSPAWGGGIWYPSLWGIAWKGSQGGRAVHPCFLHPVLFRKRFPSTKRGCRGRTCPASPHVSCKPTELHHPIPPVKHLMERNCNAQKPPCT